MTKKFNMKYFMYLYRHKNLAPRTISKSILVTFNKINIDDIYTKFIFFIFFSDTNNTLECPIQLRKLLDYEKLLDYIKNELFEKNPYTVDSKKLPSYYKAQTTVKIESSQYDIFQMFSLLLKLEINLHEIYLRDVSLIFTLVNNMCDECKVKVLQLKYKISPILCILLDSIDEVKLVPKRYIDFYHFLKSVNMEYRDGIAYLSENSINYKKLEKIILYSRYKVINEYHRIFINFYPEIIYNSKVSKNRMEYFNNPLDMPLDFKVLRSYIFCIPYYLKIFNPKLNDANFDILFRTIYLEKIFKKGLTKKWCKLLHILILDNYNLVYVLLKRKFEIGSIKMIVKYVPSFHLAFDQSVKFYRESSDKFYLNIIECLLIKYPVKEYFKKISVHLDLFPSEFTKKFAKFFDALNGEV